ncbi:MAG: hypothetical protein M0R80_04715 [Proteobacteria bacterium]|jgi:hypothetical protein|nr:hypothetical protein [Pseudomonadota bacterium]
MCAEPLKGPPPDGEKPGDDSWRDLGTEPPGPPMSEGTAAMALGRLRDVRVLVVAADTERRAALSRVLAGLRLGVETGPPDDVGYRAALAFRPDAVVSELTRPGELGWWLLQRFRRHPLLRWTPLLLMRWWKEGQPSAHEVLVARVVDNLAEALTSLRVLDERLAAGRPLGDRLEITGPLPLLKILCGAGLTGALSIHDGLNVFDIDIAAGRPAAAARRGPGDDATTGEAALYEAALCDFGRWTFRSNGAHPASPNLGGKFEELAERISRRTALVFGPDAAFVTGATPPVAVRLDRLRDYASTTSGLSYQLCETVAGGASGDELDELLREGEDRLVVERTILALMRCGALHPLMPGEACGRGEDPARAVRSASHVLAWLAAEHRLGADGVKGATARRATSTGYYQVLPSREEKIALGPAEGIVAPGAWRPSMTEDLAPDYHQGFARDERAAFRGGATPVEGTGGAGWPRHPDDPLVASELKPLALLHDSLVPSPRDAEDKGRRQMWIALGLAILLGAILVAGLVVLASSDRETPPPSGARP